MSDNKPVFLIRPANRADIPTLQALEESAAQVFANTPYPELADMSPVSKAIYERAFSEGQFILIAETDQPHSDESDLCPAGFVFTAAFDGGLHICELSVHIAFQQQGLGRMLMERAVNYAKGANYPYLSLTTYADIAWNAPFYEDFGFYILSDEDTPDQLSQILEREIAHGANPETRCVMRCDLA